MGRFHELLATVLTRVARGVYGRPRAILAGASLLTLVLGWITVTRLVVINDTDSLVNGNSPFHRAYMDYKKEFHVVEDIVVVVQSDNPERNKAAAVYLGDQFKAQGDGQFSRVKAKLDFSRLKSRFLFYLSDADLQQIESDIGGYAEAMKKDGVRLNLNSMLDTANAKFDDKYLRKADNWKEFKPFIAQFIDMLNQLADTVEGKANLKKTIPIGTSDPHAQMIDIDQKMAENEYFSFDEGRMILVLATPSVSAFKAGAPFAEPVAIARKIIATSQPQFPDVHFGLTGEPVLMDDELVVSSHDSIVAGILSFVLVALLFYFSYRHITRPICALITLLMATVWSLGCAVLTVGHLNIISQAFVAMVIGIGIDFGIQLMGRYEEELARGRSILEALEGTMRHTGVAIVTGGSTTAAAFFTMCFNDFSGLVEFGIIAGTGIILCIIANLVLLPALYVLVDQRRPQAQLQADAAASTWKTDSSINQRLVSRPWLVLAAAGAFTLLCAAVIPRIQFDYNLLNMQSPNLESVKETHRLMDKAGNSIIYGIIVVNSLDEVRAMVPKIEKLPTVATVHSLAELLPENQDEKLAAIRRIVGKLQGLQLNNDVSDQVDIVKVRAGLKQLLTASEQGQKEAKKFTLLDQRARDAVEVFTNLIPPLERALKATDGLSQEELGRRLNQYQIQVFGTMQRNLSWLATHATDRGIQEEDLPPELLERYRSPGGKYVMEVYPKENVWEREPDERFVADLRTIDPLATGTPVENYEYIELLRESYQKAALWAFGAIFILISLHFRDPRLIALTLLPLGLGIVWTLGVMGLLGLQFNPANIITLPLVIGIGVAYGVYTIDRFREEGKMTLFANSTGKAVLLSAMTEIFAFGAMMTSNYRGLYSLGLLMTIGMVSCLIASIIVLPQILTLATRKKNSP